VGRRGEITLNKLDIGAKPRTDSGDSASDKRLAEQQLISQLANHVYAEAGGDPKAAEAKLAELSKDPEHGKLFKRYQLQITGELRKAQERPKTIAQMTPEELRAAWDTMSGEEEKPTPAAAPKPVAAPKPTGGAAAAYIADLKKRKKRR
jgi:hypothetical protein